MTAPTLTITLPSRARYTLDVGRRVLTSGFAMHGHDHTELFIVLKGSGVHVLDGSRNFIRAGDVYVIRSGRSHAFTDCRNLEHYNIGFYPDLLSALGDELRRMEGFQRLFVLRPGRSRSADGLAKVQLSAVDLHAAETIADAIFRETLSRQEGHEQVARARFLELVVFLSRRYRQTVATEVDGLLRLAKAAAYIEEHYREPVRVESLAGLAGMSASHFMRVFHRHYQTSPGAYVQMLRLQHAAFDLASSSRSVTAVALANGFTDSNYFARQFRRYMRMSPREYRARERGRAGAEGTVVM